MSQHVAFKNINEEAFPQELNVFKKCQNNLSVSQNYAVLNVNYLDKIYKYNSLQEFTTKFHN